MLSLCQMTGKINTGDIINAAHRGVVIDFLQNDWDMKSTAEGVSKGEESGKGFESVVEQIVYRLVYL